MISLSNISVTASVEPRRSLTPEIRSEEILEISTDYPAKNSEARIRNLDDLRNRFPRKVSPNVDLRERLNQKNAEIRIQVDEEVDRRWGMVMSLLEPSLGLQGVELVQKLAQSEQKEIEQRAEIGDLSQELELAESKMEELREELSDAEKYHQAAEHRVQNKLKVKQQQYKEKCEQISKMLEQFTEFTIENERSKNLISDMEKSAEESTKEMKELKRERDKAIELRNMGAEKLKIALKQLDSRSKTEPNKETGLNKSEVVELFAEESLIQSYEDQVKFCQQELDELKLLNSDLTGQRDLSQKELVQVKTALDQVREERTDLELRVKSLESTVCLLESEKEELFRKNSQIENELMELKSERETKNSENLCNFEEAIQKLSAKNDEVLESLDAANMQISKIEEELKISKEKERALEAELKEKDSLYSQLASKAEKTASILSVLGPHFTEISQSLAASCGKEFIS